MKKRRDEIELVIALATGSSIREAARLAGFSERTARRRNADSDFQNRVSAARDELWGAAIGKLADTAAEAVATLRELLSCDDPKVRLGAARAVLAVAPHLREAVEHEKRLTELEARNAGSK